MIMVGLLDVCVGSTNITFSETIQTLLEWETKGTKIAVIIWKIRLPMALMAINIGGALGVSGGCMQTILDNPLASPYTLGVSASAGFGAALAIVTGWLSNTVFYQYNSSLLAVGCAMAVSLLICFMSKRRNFSKKSLILSGIALMFLFQSLQSLLQFISDTDTMQTIVFWNLGSLARADWNKVSIMVITNILVVPLVIKESWNLTALKLGDIEAKSIGIDVEKTRMKSFIYISILTAVAVSFAGSIGFIGIAAPHISRSLLGDDQRYYLVFAGVLGAVLLLISSILSKVIIPSILFPIGIVTSIIGVPFFIAAVFRGERINAGNL